MVMRNRILAITRSSIPYVPELRPLTGSVTATILMQQLDYWFERHPDGFYKFQDASPDNPAYKLGDSWAEELNFSVAELRSAFDAIGHRHKSKTEWAESTDPFHGKFYCCYTDRRTRLTFYFRNHAMVDAALDALVLKQNQSAPPTSNPMKPPIHAKSAGKATVREPNSGNFTRDQEWQLTGNADSSLTGNAQTEFPVNAGHAFTMNAQSTDSHVEKPHSQEVQDCNSAYTETTGLQETTQRPPQQPGYGSVDVTSEQLRGSSGRNDILSKLVFPKAEPTELSILAELITRCRPDNRQAVLDEVEGARQRGTLRAGIVPFARALVKAEGEGMFTLSIGAAVQAAREQAQAHALKLSIQSVAAPNSAVHPTPAEEHTWTNEEINLLPPKMRERMLAKLGQGIEPSTAARH